MRFPMRIGRGWRPLLAALGGTRKGSFVDVGETEVRFRFGPLFDETLPRRQIVGAERTAWPYWWGIGWRIGKEKVGLIGCRDGNVRVELSEPRRVRTVILPWRCRSIVVSLEDPDAFIEEIAGPGSDRPRADGKV